MLFYEWLFLLQIIKQLLQLMQQKNAKNKKIFFDLIKYFIEYKTQYKKVEYK